MLEHWWLIAGIAIAGWQYLDGIRVRELALRAGRDYCRTIGVQFLDDTVSRQRIRLARDRAGQLRIERGYGFEFTSDGEQRYSGEITMLGSRLREVQVQLHRILH